MFTYSVLNVLNEQVNSTSIDFKRKVASYLGVTENELEHLIQNSLKIVGVCGEIGQVIGTAFFGEPGKTFGRIIGECFGLILSIGHVVYKIIFRMSPSGNLEAVALPA